MKSLPAILTTMLLVFSISTHAQLTIGGLKNKASNALGNAIDRKIDQELNKAADRVVNKYWDRVIGKYYNGLYSGSGSQAGGFPFVLDENVTLEEEYAFDRIVKIKVETYSKKGKLEENMFMNTHTSGQNTYIGTQIVDEESAKENQDLMVINDFKNSAFLMLMTSDGERSRMAYRVQVATPAQQEAAQEAAPAVETTPLVYKEIGTKTIMGKTCTGYAAENDQEITEFWVTDENVFGIESMFAQNAQSSVNMPANHPKGSVMEITSTDKSSSEKTVMQVVEVQENASVKFVLADYPRAQAGTPTEE